MLPLWQASSPGSAMADRAFDLFATTIDGILSAQPARPGHGSGDAWFAAAPKELRGSLLKAKEGKDFGGGARYATIRTHQGHVVDGGLDRLRVSATGGHAAAKMMSRADLAEVCEGAVVGVLADSTNAEGRAGICAHEVGGTGAAVRLVAVEEDPNFTNIRAVTQTLGVAMDTVLSVEETVARFGLSWLPWASAPGALFVPAVPAYESTIDDARQPAAAGTGSRQEQVNETAVRAAVLASLGLTLAGGAVQVVANSQQRDGRWW